MNEWEEQVTRSATIGFSTALEQSADQATVRAGLAAWISARQGPKPIGTNPFGMGLSLELNLVAVEEECTFFTARQGNRRVAAKRDLHHAAKARWIVGGQCSTASASSDDRSG
ncbi:hypothetical protein [Sphingomonas lycopersici]|uniref:Uncharacterized protein n=1 Tax=Sphingomonas lycopersici TaxID=2951807 RepID=A0AA41Z745_9SPHN|nr:hypothetical protein [Sphingomonas lycopersici]MCW6533836.1 hypothetical protein [Sphingomonas lycopersici]